MQAILDTFLSLLPAGIDWVGIGKFLLILFGAFLILTLLGKLFFGKDSAFQQALTSAIGILFVYALAMVIYAFRPGNLARLLTPLPFVAFSGEHLYLFSFSGAHFSSICHQALSMILLVFLYNLMDEFLPIGKRLYWFVYRLLTIFMSLTLHYVVVWAFNRFLPGVLVTHAPTILVLILLSFLLMGVLKAVLGLVLAVVNPFLAAVYAFFFATKTGKQLSKATLTTLLLGILITGLHHMGYGAISVSQASLIAYIPLALILLLLWYIVGYKL